MVAKTSLTAFVVAIGAFGVFVKHVLSWVEDIGRGRIKIWKENVMNLNWHRKCVTFAFCFDPKIVVKQF